MAVETMFNDECSVSSIVRNGHAIYMSTLLVFRHSQEVDKRYAHYVVRRIMFSLLYNVSALVEATLSRDASHQQS